MRPMPTEIAEIRDETGLHCYTLALAPAYGLQVICCRDLERVSVLVYSDDEGQWVESARIQQKMLEVSVDAPTHWSLIDLLFDVRDDQRYLDSLEEGLDTYLDRKTQLARLVDIHYSRRLSR
jgi:hypothetical protein